MKTSCNLFTQDKEQSYLLNIVSFEHWNLDQIGKDYIITIRICTVVVVLFFTRLQGARPALAKREIYWYLPNRVREIPTLPSPQSLDFVLVPHLSSFSILFAT